MCKRGELMTELQDIERECYISKLNSYAAEISQVCVKYNINPDNENVLNILSLIQKQLKEIRYAKKHQDILIISSAISDIAEEIEVLKTKCEY